MLSPPRFWRLGAGSVRCGSAEDHIVVDTSLNQKLPILSVDCGPSKCATQS